jgi:Tfp pilus assembly protein PilF
VALSTTFTGGDALVANSYMKSVLRAAVEAFVRAHAGVDYFPSYEAVVLSERDYAWRADQAHVSDEMVRLNVLRMIDAYAADGERSGRVGQAAAAATAAHLARRAARAGDTGEAIDAYRRAAAAGPSEGPILFEFGRFLNDHGRFKEAIGVLEAAIHNGFGPSGGWLQLAVALHGARQYDRALAAARTARELQPNRPGALEMVTIVERALARQSARPALGRLRRQGAQARSLLHKLLSRARPTTAPGR